MAASRQRGVAVVGHRGAAGVAPENTLAGVRRAAAMGVDAVECDVRLSRDGRAVLMHDPTVDRTTDGTGTVEAMDFAELRALDAGGEPVPELGELLGTLGGSCGLLCELKVDAAAGAAVDAVVARGRLEGVVFISFSPGALAGVRRADPRARLGLLLPPPAHDPGPAAELGCELVGLHHRSASPDAAAAARRRGLRVNVWTPNTPAEMRAAIALRPDSITTDRPDLLLARLGRRHD